jgi:uncharacterized protein (TIGR02757 family)
MGSRKIEKGALKDFLESKVRQYNTPAFIANDPVSIPHLFSRREDIEIAGFFAAIFAWGQRPTILRKCRELLDLMDNDPYRFVRGHSDKDLKRFLRFKHRTFNSTDTLYFIRFFRWFYEKHASLAEAFPVVPEDQHVGRALVYFHHLFFSLPDFPGRTRKHISTPERRSTCKRINMYLRWMVRDDKNGVDFGLWKNIRPDQLICPFDLHVDRISRKLRLIHRKQTDWFTALELTDALKQFDAADPVKYDFALFGVGVNEFSGIRGLRKLSGPFKVK